MIILASASPRRHELLLNAGLDHLVQPTHVPEQRLPGESPEALVQRLASEKAAPLRVADGDLILGADTVVCCNGEIYGKPENLEAAAQMLRQLSGRSHLVHTGICLRTTDCVVVDICTTEVWFFALTESEIEEYTRSGESGDKAGAYAIQGCASRFVEKINGCYHNVVGLPVSLVYRHLREMNWPMTDCAPTGERPSSTP